MPNNSENNGQTMREIIVDIQKNVNNLIPDVSALKSDMEKVRAVLIGDEFNKTGLVEEQKTLYTKFYKLRDDVREIKIIGGVLYSLLTIGVGALAIFYHK